MSCPPASLTVALLLLTASVSRAQGELARDFAASARIAVVQGSATLERGGVDQAAVENLPLLQGDRLRTDSGRLEVLLPDRSVLDLDRDTSVELFEGGLVRLLGGRLIFVVALGPGGDIRRDYHVDAPAGSVRFTHAGEYRVSSLSSAGIPFVEVSVVRGRAVLDADGRSLPLSAGERAQSLQGQGITALGSFNSVLADVFVEWAELQRGPHAAARTGALLSPELQAQSGTFDRGGAPDRAVDDAWAGYPPVEDDWSAFGVGTWYPGAWAWTWTIAGRWAWRARLSSVPAPSGLPVPRGGTRPRDSRSPYYYLGPSRSRSAPAYGVDAAAAPALPPADAPVPGTANHDRATAGTAAPDRSTPPPSSAPSSAWFAASPRSESGRARPSEPGIPSSHAGARSSGADTRASGDSGEAASGRRAGGRQAGGASSAPSPSAPTSSGISGGRAPGRAPSGSGGPGGVNGSRGGAGSGGGVRGGRGR
jgi:hypothetical protein